MTASYVEDNKRSQQHPSWCNLGHRPGDIKRANDVWTARGLTVKLTSVEQSRKPSEVRCCHGSLVLAFAHVIDVIHVLFDGIDERNKI